MIAPSDPPAAAGRLVLPVLFLAVTLPVILFLALMVPSGETPDEVAHILRANSLLHGNVMGYRVPSHDGRMAFDGGVTANESLLVAGFAFRPDLPIAAKKMTPAHAAQLETIPWAARAGFISVPNTSVYSPLLYIPAAIGMGVAHVAGFGPYDSIIAARLANVLAFAVLATAALRLARHGRFAIFAVLSLPMTIWLAGSVSQDGLLIATAALAAAALTRAGEGRGAMRWLAGCGIVTLIAAKPAYLPLALAMLAPLRWHGSTRRDVRAALAGVALVAAAGLAWTLVTMRLVSVPFVRGAAYHPGPLWPGDPATLFKTTDVGAQLRVLLHDPLLLATLPLQAVLQDWHNLLYQTVGVLGVLAIVLPLWLYGAWSVAVAGAFAAELLRARAAASARPCGVGGVGALAVAVAACASVFGVFVTMYLSWTLVGQTAIEGVQGRYFLPVLPFLGIAVPAIGASALRPVRWLAAAPVLALAVFDVAVIPELVVTMYYLH